MIISVALTDIREDTGGDIFSVVDALVAELDGQREAREVPVHEIRSRRQAVGPAACLEGGEDGPTGLVTQQVAQVTEDTEEQRSAPK